MLALVCVQTRVSTTEKSIGKAKHIDWREAKRKRHQDELGDQISEPEGHPASSPKSPEIGVRTKAERLESLFLIIRLSSNLHVVLL